MNKLYNSYSKSAFLGMMLILNTPVLIAGYIWNTLQYGTLFIPIIEVVSSQFPIILFLVASSFSVLLIATTTTGYVITDDGIGFSGSSKGEWHYAAHTKWEDIVSLNYKKSILFGIKGLEIHSHEMYHSPRVRSKFRNNTLFIDKRRYGFKDIVHTVCKKTGIQLD